MIAEQECVQITEAEYYADTLGIRNSHISDVLKSPSLYYGKWIAGDIKSDESEALRIGSALHCLLLEYGEYKTRFAVSPRCDRRTKEGKLVYESFRTHSIGKQVISADEADTALACSNAIAGHPDAMQLIRSIDVAERMLWWVDDATGLLCKAKLDGIAYGNIIVDLKTSRDPYPEAFARSCLNHGYHRQAAWYKRACEANGLASDPKFVFIVVGSQKPHDVFVYELDPNDISLGDSECQRGLNLLVQCATSNDWTHPDSRGVRSLRLPKWAHTREEW